jgi:hypothetical protein
VSLAKLHHFVPQFYLRYWCDLSGKLWAYPLSGQAPWRANPKSVAAETYLYKPGPFQEGDDPADENTESWFSSWEGLFAARWPSVFDHAGDALTRRNLARFIGTMFARHPDQRDAVLAMNQQSLLDAADVPDGDAVEYVNPWTEQRLAVDASSIRKQARTDPVSVRTDFIRLLRTMSEVVADSLYNRRWGILVSATKSFVTSDRPVGLERGSTMKPTFGFATPGTVAWFPVSPDRMLLVHDELDAEFAAYEDSDEILWIENVVRTAQRFVFSSRKDDRVAIAIRRHRAQTALSGTHRPML